MGLALLVIDLRLFTLLCICLASIHSFALKINPVVSSVGNSVIQPGDEIRVSWTAEAGDPARFDIDLIFPDGTRHFIRADIDINDGSAICPLPGNIPSPASYTVGMAVKGNPFGPFSPSFQVGSAPTTTKPASNPTKVATVTTTLEDTQTPSRTPLSKPAPAITTTSALSTKTTQSGRANETSSTSITSTNTIQSGHTLTFALVSTNSNGDLFTTTIMSYSPGATEAAPTGSFSGNTKKSSTGAMIAGGIAGGVVLLVVIGIIIVLLMRRRRKASSESKFLLLPGAPMHNNHPMSIDPSISSGEETPELLMRQNELLSERIMALEAERRDLATRLDDTIPPPAYNNIRITPEKLRV